MIKHAAFNLSPAAVELSGLRDQQSIVAVNTTGGAQGNVAPRSPHGQVQLSACAPPGLHCREGRGSGGRPGQHDVAPSGSAAYAMPSGHGAVTARNDGPANRSWTDVSSPRPMSFPLMNFLPADSSLKPST
jgi:hypothetical protein